MIRVNLAIFKLELTCYGGLVEAPTHQCVEKLGTRETCRDARRILMLSTQILRK